MDASPRFWELEFELAVATHLEEHCGLRVHIDGDVLNRRRSGYATLQFHYDYAGGSAGRAKVRICLAGAPHCSRSLAVNLRDPEAMAKVLPLCEDLAPHIRAYSEQSGAAPAPQARRDDD